MNPKLQKLAEIFKESTVDFSQFDENLVALKQALTEKIRIKTVDDVQKHLKDFQDKIDFSKIEGIAEDIKSQVESKIGELTDAVEQEKQALMTATQSGLDAQGRSVEQIRSELDLLAIDLKTLQSSKTTDLLNDEIAELKVLGNGYVTELASLAQGLEATNQAVGNTENTLRSEIVGVTSSVITLRSDLTNRINNLPRGGGNANRNISVGGNSSVLSRYGDINLKPGSNVTLTYSNNDTTKNLDLTIAATGGSGTTRSINRVSTSGTMAAAVGTDYVYISTAGTQQTLPTAIGNSNLYTVKNVAASSVLISTTAAQTIDGDTTLILATQYTAVDLINDGNDNWSIT